MSFSLTEKVDAAMGLLQERELELKAQVATLRAAFVEQTRPIAAELKTVRRAMRGLSHTSRIELSIGSQARGFTKDEVIALVAERLATGDLVSNEELRLHISAEARRQGCPRQGLHLQFKRALQSDLFEQTGDALRLRSTAAPVPSI